MSRKSKYPHLKDLYHTNWNAYLREWRKLNPRYTKVKDEWRKLDSQTFDELPDDVVEIPDYPTYYARPNGEIWRDTREVESAIKCGKARVLKLKSTFNAKNGYWIVQPYLNGKKKAVHLHRLILTTFKGNPPLDKPECHHIDHDTSNNSIDNLMWVSRQENADYVPNYKRRVSKTKLSEGRKVSETRWSAYYPQIKEMIANGVKPIEISRILNIPVGTIYYLVKRV